MRQPRPIEVIALIITLILASVWLRGTQLETTAWITYAGSALTLFGTILWLAPGLRAPRNLPDIISAGLANKTVEFASSAWWSQYVLAKLTWEQVVFSQIASSLVLLGIVIFAITAFSKQAPGYLGYTIYILSLWISVLWFGLGIPKQFARIALVIKPAALTLRQLPGAELDAILKEHRVEAAYLFNCDSSPRRLARLKDRILSYV